MNFSIAVRGIFKLKLRDMQSSLMRVERRKNSLSEAKELKRTLSWVKEMTLPLLPGHDGPRRSVRKVCARLVAARSVLINICPAKLDSRDLLEREYLFIDVVSTFLRTIRAGAIRVQHGAVVLAHYGRLEVAFDTCSKIIVDVLREENIMKEKPELIASVITQAVQEVRPSTF
jgi:hypothetical protein